MLTFECPSCKSKLQVADEHAGKTIQCPTCKSQAAVPTSTEAPSDAIVEAAPTPMPEPETPTAVTTPEHASAKKKPRRDREDEDDDRDRDDEDRPRRRREQSSGSGAAVAGISIITVVLIMFGVIGCCVVPILVALLVPAVQKVREAAARTQSINNLKQIALACQSYHDVNKKLPFNGIGPADPKHGASSGSWAYQILPFIDQAPMFNNPENFKAVGIAAYMCPGRGRPLFEAGGGPWTDYFYNNYLNSDVNMPNNAHADHPNNPDLGRTLHGITDGTSNTILAGHGNINLTQYGLSANVTLSTNIFMGGTAGTIRAGGDGNANPPGVTLRRDSDNNPTIGSWGGPFPQGGLMGLADGSVHMFPYSMNNFGAFLTPSGGEFVNPPN